MLHTRTARFDVTGTVALFAKTFRELNKGMAYRAPCWALWLRFDFKAPGSALVQKKGA